MPDDHATTEQDLKEAREIARLSGPYVGNRGTLPENVAIAIAKGIAFGRKQGIEMARSDFRELAHAMMKANPEEAIKAFGLAMQEVPEISPVREPQAHHEHMAEQPQPKRPS
jgi:hypothetical protein